MMNKDNTNTNTTTSSNNMNEDDVSVTTNGSTITMHTSTTNNSINLQKSYEPLYRKSDTKNVYTSNDNDSPLDKMNPYNLIERVFLTWMSPLMSLGTRKILESEDIFSLPKELKSKMLLEHTQRAWADEIKECKAKHKKVYIEKVLLKLYGSGLILAFISTIPFMVATLVQPYFIEAIMLSISEENFNFIGMTNGIHVAIVLGIISVVSIVCFNQAAYNNCFVGVKIRTAILNLIFDKALKLSIASKTAHRSGEIMTLIAADPERLWQCIIVSTWLFIGPINVILAMALLLYEVGYSVLAALATMILVLLVQGKSSIEIGRVRSQLVKYTDERTKIMNEVLCGIRVVKMYDWESAVASRISFIRDRKSVV
jgi:ABC-type bacteriocin/lantibiotic exporter with double-glycine peptidase domain